MNVHGPDSLTHRHLAQALDGVETDAVLYVPRRGQPNPDAAEEFFATVPASVPLLVLSSAAVYPPSHHHPGMVREEIAPPPRTTHSPALAWRRLEAAAREVHPERLTLLRPATVAADPDEPLARLLHGRFAATLPGHDPTVQFLSLEDLARGVGEAVRRGLEGVVHLAPAGNIPLRRALRRAGVRRIPIPRWILRLWSRLRGREPADLEARRYSWTVDSGILEGRDSSAVAVLRALGKPVGEASGKAVPEEPSAPPCYDDFGMDRDYIAAFGRTLFPFLHDVWWRVEHRGLEHVPQKGRVVLAGTHRGFQPWDGVMLLHFLVRELGRYPRFLIHPGLIKFPFLFNYMTKLGGVVACKENAARILEADHPLGIFPEGIQGAFSYYRDAYRLGRFGRGEYIRMALRHRAPIVPVVTVGSAEIYPILAKIRWHWFEKTTEWPCLPVTPNLGTIPLPSKWHTQFLEPLPVHEQYGPEAAEDPEVVRALNTEVRRRMQSAMDAMSARRPSVFFGSAFPKEAP